MNVLISGLNGTVAPYVADVFKKNKHQVFPYDRQKISTSSLFEIKDYLVNYEIDLVIHLAMGSVEWTEILAKVTNELEIGFIYISTVSVFSNHQIGPHDIHKIPEPDDDYGTYKRACELTVQASHPLAKIIRLGWQIGYQDGQNQMLSYIYKEMKEKGYVSASSLWYPSCSFLKDSAQAIYDIQFLPEPGIYHVNSNLNLSFYDICLLLGHKFPNIIVKENKDFSADHRMIDPRVKMKTLGS
jgi:dTDP-4-dehydrorhamnose reductase